jgi:hypothetical protein
MATGNEGFQQLGRRNIANDRNNECVGIEGSLFGPFQLQQSRSQLAMHETGKPTPMPLDAPVMTMTLSVDLADMFTARSCLP